MSTFPRYSSAASAYAGSMGSPSSVIQRSSSRGFFSDLGGVSRGSPTEVAVSPSMNFPIGATRRYGKTTSIVSVKKGAPYTRAGNQHIPADLSVRKKYYDKNVFFRVGKSASGWLTDIPVGGATLDCFNTIEMRNNDADKADVQRVGDKVVITSWELNMALYQNATAQAIDVGSPALMNNYAALVAQSYRIVLFIETVTKRPSQIAGALTSMTGVIASASSGSNRRNHFTGLRNMSNTRRIQVLWDKTIDCNPSSCQAITLGGQPHVSVNADCRVFRLSFGMRLPVEFDDEDDHNGLVDSILNNSLQIGIFSNNISINGSAANYGALIIHSRVRFLDD